MKTLRFNLLSLPINSEYQYMQVVYEQIVGLGLVAKVSAIIIADIKLKHSISKLHERLCIQNPNIQLCFSVNCHYQDLINITESWIARNADFKELELSTEFLKEFTVRERSSQLGDDVKYSSYIHLSSIFNESLHRIHSISQANDYDYCEKTMKFISHLKSKIEDCYKSYQNSAFFIGSLLDPSIFTKSDIFINDQSSDFKLLLKETCRKEWNKLQSSSIFTDKNRRIRSPFDQTFAIEDEVILKN
jgi:hypothetical protein